MIKKLIEFESFCDERGMLVAMENNRNIPFEIKRIYYIFNVGPGLKRGCHALKSGSKVAVCLRGSCKFLLDDGANKEEIILNSPMAGLFIPNWTWIELSDFSPDCLLMVLCSNYFNLDDYISPYEKFIRLLEERNKTESISYD